MGILLFFLLGFVLDGTITLNKDPYSQLSRSIVYLDSINSGLIDTTDSNGDYSITVSAETYDIYFTHSSYFSDSLMSVVISSDTTFDEELRYIPPTNSNRPHYEWNRYPNVTLRTFLNVLYNFRCDGRGIIEEFYSPSYNGLWGVQENIRKTTGDTCNYIVYLGLEGDSISYADTAGYAITYQNDSAYADSSTYADTSEYARAYLNDSAYADSSTWADSSVWADKLDGYHSPYFVDTLTSQNIKGTKTFLDTMFMNEYFYWVADTTTGSKSLSLWRKF